MWGQRISPYPQLSELSEEMLEELLNQDEGSEEESGEGEEARNDTPDADSTTDKKGTPRGEPPQKEREG